MADTIGNVWPRNSSAMLSYSVPMNPSQTKGWWYLFEDDLSLLPLPGLIFGRTNYNFFRILDQYSTYWHRICSHVKLYCARISQWTKCWRLSPWSRLATVYVLLPVRKHLVKFIWIVKFKKKIVQKIDNRWRCYIQIFVLVIVNHSFFKVYFIKNNIFV